MPAFDFAVFHGADVFEIDVRLSRDNQVMVFHDETLERTTNSSGPVRAIDAYKLQQLDAAYHFTLDSQYPQRGTGVHILTLAEVLLRYPDMRLNIDIKDADEIAVVETGQVLERLDATGRCVLSSFHTQQVARCRALFPQVKCSMSYTEIWNYYIRFLTGQLLGSRHSAGLFQVPVSYYGLPLSGRRFIGSIHRGGGEINYWTINDAAQMMKLLALGADGIVTDRADLAKKVIEEFATV